MWRSAVYAGNRRVAGSGEVVDGVYRFAATKTDGEAWHVKLESNYPTVSGRDYRVTYRFHSNVRGKVKFGDFQEFEIQPGENTVTGMLIASSGTSYLDLQLGMLPPFSIDFRSVEVEEYADEVEYEDALSVPVNFEKEKIVYERHDQGYAPIPTREKDGISLYYFATAWDTGVWKSRLYVKTSLVPEAGVHYRITADMSCDQDMPFEVLFNNGDEEKGYGALYGQSLTAGETKQVEAVIIGSGGGDSLVLQFSLGEAPEESTVRINNVHVEKIRDRYTSMLSTGFALNRVVETGKILHGAIPTNFKPLALGNFSWSGTDTVFTGADDGYVVNLEEGADSATMRISQAPASDRGVWKAKLYAATGVTLQAGTTYRIKYDLQSEKDQAEYEVCFDGSTENAYGALYGRSLTAGGTDSVEYYVTPDASHGPLTLRLQLGKTDTTEGNTVTLSNLSVEAVTPQVQELGTVALSTGSAGNTWEEHADGVEQTLATSGGTATLNVSAARSEGGVWSSKLFIRTGVTPEAGARYRVSATVAATGDTGEFEFLYQNTGASELYGGQWGLSGAGDYSSDFTAPSDGCGELVLLFQLGNSAAGNTVTVSNLQVRRLSGSTEQAVELSGFAYPVAGVEAVAFNSFDLECSNGAAAVLTGNGSSASATVTTPGDDWHVKLYAKTGMELQSGKTYTITMNVAGADGCQVCYKRVGGEETDYGTENVSSGTVTHTVTPETTGTLEILLKIGDVAPGTVVTVSNIQIGENTGSSVDITPSGFGYPVAEEGSAAYNSFDLECNSGAVASLGGDGSSATATVTTPGDDWHVKLYAKPGLELQAGKTYQITMNVTGADGCQVCYKRLNGEETDYGTENVSSGTVIHTVKPETTGTLEILLKIGNVPANTAVTVSSVQIAEYSTGSTNITPTDFAYPVTESGSVEKNSFDLDANSGAAATLSGNGSSATATVTTPGDDWHVKLYAKPGVTLEAGQSYTVSMDVTGASGCTACYKNTATGAEDGFGTETIGSETVTHTVTPAESGTMEILLKIGNVAANTAVTVSNVQISKSTSDSSDITLTGFGYPVTTAPVSNTVPASYLSQTLSLSASAVAWDESAATASVEGGSASLNVTQERNLSLGGMWSTRLEVNTGVTLEKGVQYKVSGTLTSEQDLYFEVLYSNGTDEGEHNPGGQGYAEGSWDLRVESAGPPAKFEKVFTVPERSEYRPLVLRIQVGNGPAPNNITVSNINVEKYVPEHEETTGGTTTPNSFELEANSGAAATLTGDGSSAKATVTTPGADWNVKLYAKTGVTLEAGKTYQITMNVTGADGWNVCYKRAGGGENDFDGALSFGETVTNIVTPTQSGTLEILLKLGAIEANGSVTVSNIHIYEVTSSDGNITLTGFNYPVSTAGSAVYNSFELEANSGAAATLTGDGSSAKATVTNPGDDWNVKLYAKPGLELQAGKTYTITMNVAGASGCTACYKNTATGAEDGFGTETIGSGTVTHTVTPSENGTMVILLKIGNVPANTVVTVSNIQIQIAENASSYDNITLAGFGYPVVKAASTADNSFELEANSGAAASLTGNGSSATATVTTPGADWNVKLYAKTGVTLEAGKTYQITMNVTGAGGWNVCYKRAGGGENDFDGSLTFGETVTNTVTPSESGTLEILLKLGAIEANGSVTVSNIRIVEYSSSYDNVTPYIGYPAIETGSVAYNAFDLDCNSGAAASLTGNGSSATATVTVPGDDWHIKLYAKTGVMLEAGTTYRIDAKVSGADGWKINYKREGGEETDFDGSVTFGETVSNTVTPTESGKLEILLKLGDIAAGGSVTVSDISITRLGEQTPGDNLMGGSLTTATPGSVSFWAHEDYAAALSGDGSSASLVINSAPAEGREAWKVKLFVETGITLNAGKRYRISADVSASAETNYEICYNNGAEEKGVGALYGLHAAPASQTAVYEAAPGSDANLVLQFNLGWAASPDTVTVRNVKVEELSYAAGEAVLPSFHYDSVGYLNAAADAGYVTSLNQSANSATLRIQHAPDERNPWNVKLNVRTGFTPAAQKGYRVSFDIDAIGQQGLFEVFYDGNTEAAYGALYGQSLSAGKKTVSYTIMPGDSRGELSVQIRLGKTDGSNGNAYTISNLKIEEVSFRYTQTLETKDAASLQIQNGYQAKLERKADTATLKIDKTPTEGREPWKSKLFVVPGTTLRAGQKYRISMDVKSIIPAPFEICFNNGGEEKGLGAMFGLMATPSGQHIEYVTYPRQDTLLELQLSLGNCAAPNSIIVSGVKVERAGAVEMVSDTVYTF